MRESLTSFFSLETTTGVDRKGLGALLSPILGLLSTQMLHLNAGSVVPTHYGSWGAIIINIVAVSTCVEVVLSAVEIYEHNN